MAQQHFNIGAAKNLKVALPPIDAQRRIAGVLSAYDDLIENNTRRIAILEEMARRLYEEWFVHFRFPGHDKAAASELTPVGALAQVVRGRSYKSAELAEDCGLPFVNLKCVNRDGGFRRDGLKRFVGRFKPEQRVLRGDIVMAVTDMTQERRIVARAALVPDLGQNGGVISMDLVRLVPEPGIPPLFLYASLRWSDFADNVKGHASGTNVLHLHPDQIRKHPVFTAAGSIQAQYASSVAPLFASAELLERQIANLRVQRDLLLPKLVSGEIDLAAAEALAMAAE